LNALTVAVAISRIALVEDTFVVLLCSVYAGVHAIAWTFVEQLFITVPVLVNASNPVDTIIMCASIVIITADRSGIALAITLITRACLAVCPRFHLFLCANNRNERRCSACLNDMVALSSGLVALVSGTSIIVVACNDRLHNTVTSAWITCLCHTLVVSLVTDFTSKVALVSWSNLCWYTFANNTQVCRDTWADFVNTYGVDTIKCINSAWVVVVAASQQGHWNVHTASSVKRASINSGLIIIIAVVLPVYASICLACLIIARSLT